MWRRRHDSSLEHELRAVRPEADPAFVATIADRIGDSPRRARPGGYRLAAVAAVTVGVLAAAGIAGALAPSSPVGSLLTNLHLVSAQGTSGTSSPASPSSAATQYCTGNVNVRWHYRANPNGKFTSGSWSGTTSVTCTNGSISMGPQAMEGDLKVLPGTTMQVGYDFTLPGNKIPRTGTFTNPQVTFIVHCANNSTPSQPTWTIPMSTQTYSVSKDEWEPSGDQSSALVFQGSAAVPAFCGAGQQVRFDKGGTFTATVQITPP